MFGCYIDKNYSTSMSKIISFPSEIVNHNYRHAYCIFSLKFLLTELSQIYRVFRNKNMYVYIQLFFKTNGKFSQSKSFLFGNYFDTSNVISKFMKEFN